MALQTVDPAEPEKPEERSADPAGLLSEVAGQKAEEEYIDDETEKSWVEIQVIDAADQPVAGERIKLELADGRVVRSTTDELGIARIENIPPGTHGCCLSNLDKEAWEPA